MATLTMNWPIRPNRSGVHATHGDRPVSRGVSSTFGTGSGAPDRVGLRVTASRAPRERLCRWMAERNRWPDDDSDVSDPQREPVGSHQRLVKLYDRALARSTVTFD